MPVESTNQQPAGSMSLRVDGLALSTAVRTLQGFSVASVLVTVSSGQAVFEPFTWCWVPLSIAAMVCGMGVGTAVDRWCQLTLSLKSALAWCVLATTGGLLLLWMSSEPTLILAATLLIGLGAASEWSSCSGMARQSLSNRVRWKGMRWWIAAFPFGILLCVAVSDVSERNLVAAAVAAGLAAGIAVLRPLLPSPTVDASDNAPAANTNAGRSGAAADPIVGVAESPVAAAGLAADCDEAECCGGTARNHTPPSFRQGVIISAVGLCSLFGPVFGLMGTTLTDGATFAAVSLAAGLVGGYLLMFSAAPHAGYTVTLLPFLVLSAPAVLAGALVPAESGWFPAICFLCGFLPGGVACGCAAMIGESFSDCPTDSQRTRLLSVSRFVTSVFVLAVASLQFLSPSATVVIMVESLVFVLGILVLRAIPSPVIASSGRDEADAEQDSELQDVIAAINN